MHYIALYTYILYQCRVAVVNAISITDKELSIIKVRETSLKKL